jgi:hypothetical protein
VGGDDASLALGAVDRPLELGVERHLMTLSA